MTSLALGFLALLLPSLFSAPIGRAQGNNYSLRFYGHGVNDIDRVKISIDAPARPVDVGTAAFTIEWWMKADLSDNGGSVTCNTNDGWITGNIIFDRDIWDDGDYGDYGVALHNGRIAFGVNNGTTGTTVCGSINVANGQWHHVAVTRSYPDGNLRVFVDGVADGQRDGPNGDVSYRDGRSTGFEDDPFLVIGAEKHDAGSSFPSYDGFVDELRVSNAIRYSGNFTPPAGPFTTDANTVALYHFDEGPAGACATGTTILDSSGAAGGPSNGVCRYGGSAPAGPVYTIDTPFGGGQAPTPTPTLAILGTPDAVPLASLAIVSWHTNIPADSRVQVWQDAACTASWLYATTHTAQVLAHSVVLTDLTPTTTYCYQVQSANGISVTAWIEGQAFTTLATQYDAYLPLIEKSWLAP